MRTSLMHDFVKKKKQMHVTGKKYIIISIISSSNMTNFKRYVIKCLDDTLLTLNYIFLS